jgi:hypothetical protein
MVLFLALGMFAAKEPGGFSPILPVAQSDRVKVLTFRLQPRCGAQRHPLQPLVRRQPTQMSTRSDLL